MLTSFGTVFLGRRELKRASHESIIATTGRMVGVTPMIGAGNTAALEMALGW
jgi:hypothetical protein